MAYQGAILAVLLQLITLIITAVSDKTPLYILGLYPMSGAWNGGVSFLPATQLALEHINANQSLLPDFELRLIYRDTRCDAARGTHEMYEELHDSASPTKIMLFGAGCSQVTESTAKLTPLWNLIQLSYSSSSPKLSDRSLFPRLFRMEPPLTMLNDVVFSILKHYGWTKVATLHQTLDVLSLSTSDFINQAKDHGIEVLASESFADDPSIQIANLKRQGARIIIGNFYEQEARLVFCAAYKHGMYDEKYLWIINGWYSSNWWKHIDEKDPESCTLQQMKEAVEGYLSRDVIYLSASQEPGISGLTGAEFAEELGKRVIEAYDTDDLESLTGWHQSSLAYDGVWTIALTLQKANKVLQDMDRSQTVADFTYDDAYMTEIFFNIMEETRFEGVSGPVQFTSSGDRRGLMQVKQNQNGSEVQIGRYNPNRVGHELIWTNNTPVYWQGGMPPADFIKVREEYTTPSNSAKLDLGSLLSYIITVLCILMN